jgi:hypothetical protein
MTMYVIKSKRTGLYWSQAMEQWVKDINLATQTTFIPGVMTRREEVVKVELENA